MTPAIETVEALDEMRARVLCADAGYAGERLEHFWSSFLPKASAIHQADERAGLVTARRFNREALQAMAGLALIANGGMPQDCDELADFFDWFQDVASPFASAAQGEGGE